jgi:hypothetical protein
VRDRVDEHRADRLAVRRVDRSSLPTGRVLTVGGALAMKAKCSTRTVLASAWEPPFLRGPSALQATASADPRQAPYGGQDVHIASMLKVMGEGDCPCNMACCLLRRGRQRGKRSPGTGITGVGRSLG